MGLSLEEIRVISEIANLLYDFLPGNPHPFADQSISFKGLAHELDLGNFWPGGSKLPAIINLLEKTLEFKPQMFYRLILETVKRGIKYRAKKGREITREEIEKLNQLLLKIHFKIPELWNRNFLDSLPSQKKEISEKKEALTEKIKQLKKELINLANKHPQQKGYAFEKFLQEFFETFKLNPRSPFKVMGEQIDGSIELDGHTYLIEAKWQDKLVGESELLVLKGKVESKATWSRGLFISYSGFTKEGLEAFSKGKATNLIAMTGEDLWAILDGEMNLDEAIRLKSRYAAETGKIMIRIYELRNLYKFV